MGPGGSTIDAAEVARFAALADTWWDPAGKMGMLHKFNPVRLGFIKEAACRRFGRDLVGPARQDGHAAQVQSGAARLYQAGGLPAVRARP